MTLRAPNYHEMIDLCSLYDRKADILQVLCRLAHKKVISSLLVSIQEVTNGLSKPRSHSNLKLLIT